MIRQAWLTLPSCFASSSTPTLLRMIFSSLVIVSSPRSDTRCLRSETTPPPSQPVGFDLNGYRSPARKEPRPSRSDAHAAPATGPPAPPDPRPDTAPATCTRSSGSPRTPGTTAKSSLLQSRKTKQSASARPSDRSLSTASARPSLPIQKPVTHVPGLFCYLSTQFGPGRLPLPPGEGWGE